TVVLVLVTLFGAVPVYAHVAHESPHGGGSIAMLERMLTGWAASVAHVIAALGLELSKVGRPPEIHFGWSHESPVVANLGFLLFGEGNVPWVVRELIVKAEPDPAKQPRVVIG